MTFGGEPYGPNAALHPVVRLAPAKVNLTLSIGPRRPDGFHELHSVMVPIDLADRLSLAPAYGAEDSLHVDGDASPIRPDDLVLRGIAAARRAARRLAGPAAEPFPLAARLEKRIPIAAGLAGGSSDAAAAIDAALACWGIDVVAEDRLAVAADVGSDVPFFLAGGPALVEGRGERVTPLPRPFGPPPSLLIVTPAVAVSTTEAFRLFDAGGAAGPTDATSTRITSQHLATELRDGLRTADLVVRAGVLAMANDLIPAAQALVPALRAFRRALARRLARPIGQSGSGPSLWALYPSLAEAQADAAALEAELAGGALDAPGHAPPRVFAATMLPSRSEQGRNP